MVSSSAWLSAALLAVNSGGAIALGQVIERVGYPRLSLAFFVAGIICGLLNVFVIQIAAQRSSEIAALRVIN